MSTLSMERLVIPSASLGRENPLPDLKANQDAHANINVDAQTISPEESQYMGWGRVNGILPYTILDNYNREKKPRAWKAAVLENDCLRATFLPELGGRLWSLVDKKTGRELLCRNPVFQPCNLGLRNAWISGGVEWNLGIIGHTPFTVSSLYAETVEADGEPILRMYQYERVRHLVYRVEASLAGDRLYVRIKIDNARQQDTAVYWWSNIAVDEREDVRVIVPSERAFRYGYGGALTKVPYPYQPDWDASRSVQIPQSMDFFFDIPENRLHWIAALGKDGYGLVETSTPELIGRKLFVWGMGAGGRRWQEFLADKDTAYVEIQCGLAHTQLEHLPFAAGASVEWVEAYGPMQADANVVQGKDWDTANRCVEEKLDALVSKETLETMRARFHSADGAHGAFVHQADGWAHLEQLLGGFDAHGLRFPAARLGSAEREWKTLLTTGALPCPDPLASPCGYQVSDEWMALLRKSIENGNGHWYAWYQLGVMLAYRNQRDEARHAFEMSLQQQKSPWALRCLAVLDRMAGDLASAAGRMLEAVAMRAQRNLAIEALETLVAAEQYDKVEGVAASLPAGIRRLGRVKVLRTKALLETGKLSAAERILRGNIVLTDVREGEISLSNLWFRLQELKHTDEPLPAHLDFRMH